MRTIALEYVSSGKEEAWRTELKAFCLEKVRKNLDWCLAEGRDECGGGNVRVCTFLPDAAEGLTKF